MQEIVNNVELQVPCEEHRKMYEQALSQLRKSGSTLKHPDGIFDYEHIDFNGVLEKVEIDRKGVVEGRVPASTLFLVDTQREVLLGAINIRHHIDHPNLCFRNGHIGYGVLPSEQRKGYGTIILQLGLIEAKRLGIKKVLVTCNSLNEGSKKVIEKNGGIFESEQQDKNGEMFKRYWIHL